MPSLSVIYRQHFAYVWAVLRRLGVPDADVEDLVQEVFVVAHRRRSDFEGRSSIRTWLYAIAVRLYLNDMRKRRRRAQPAPFGPERSAWADPWTVSASGLRSIDEQADPELYVARAQARTILRDLLDNLDEDKRVVFVLSELEGLPAPTIARITGAKTRTVYSRLRAARDRFSADLARVHARERNNVTVQSLLRRGRADDRPPAGAQQRIHAALLAKLGLAAAAPVATGWTTLKAGAVSLAIGAAGLGAITLSADASHDPAPRPSAGPSVDPAGPAAVASARPAPTRSPQPTSDRSSADPVSKTESVPSPSRGHKRGDPRQHHSLTKELALMKQAREALRRSKPERALELLDQHRARFPQGTFSNEREQTRWTALCMAGRIEEATTLGPAIRLGDCPSTTE